MASPEWVVDWINAMTTTLSNRSRLNPFPNFELRLATHHRVGTLPYGNIKQLSPNSCQR